MSQGYHEQAEARKSQRRSLAIGLLAGLVGGAMGWLVYPEPGWWPLAWLMYVPLLAWIQWARPGWRAALLTGWLAGVVLHAGVFAFLAYTMREMSGLPAPIGWSIVAVHALAMGLHQGLFAAAVAATQRLAVGPGRRALQLAALFAVVEFALPWMFRWYLGNAFYRAPQWIQLADVFGVIGVSAAAVAVSWLLAVLLVGRGQRRRAAVALVVLLGSWAGYGEVRLRQLGAQQEEAAKSGQLWTALAVQHNATLVEKRSSETAVRLGMLQRLEDLTRAAKASAVGQGVDAVVWAEGAFPFQWGPDDVGPQAAKVATRAGAAQLAAKARVWQLSKDLGVPLLLGTLRRVDLQWRQPARNGSVLMQDGQPKWTYDKQILLPFGEYLPGSDMFPQIKGAIAGISDFDGGTTSGLVGIGGATVLVNICYEALFAGFLRGEAVPGAQVLVNLTNDLWFGAERAPELHLMVQSARAVELRRPMLRATVTGISAWVGADGVIRGETPVFQSAVLRADVPLVEADSPYRRWGDLPLWLLTAWVLGWLIRTLLVDKRAAAWPNTQPSGKGAT